MSRKLRARLGLKTRGDRKAERQARIRNEQAAAAQRAGWVAEGRNEDGSYKRPTFQSQLDPATGMLKDQYRIGAFKPIELDRTGLNKFRQEALRDGPSAWANMQMDALRNLESQQMDQMADSERGQMAQAMDMMSEQGGLSSGARERMAMGGVRDNLLSRQRLRQDMGNRGMQIKIQDEQNRINQLGQLPGMELAALEPEFKNRQFEADQRQFDIRNALGEVQNQRNDDMEGWKTNMQTWAANRTADAQAKAARKGGK